MFDVAVIGGGPAGCAAAVRLRYAGVSVALFDRTDTPRPRLGESVPPQIRLPLEKLGLWSEFLRQSHTSISGIDSIWSSPAESATDYIFSIYGSGWVIDRRRFNSMLRKAAAAAGCKLYCRSRVTMIEQIQSYHAIRAARQNGSDIIVKARFIIQATGRLCLIGGLGRGRSHADRSVALAVRFTSLVRQAATPRPLVEASEHGWWYLAPVSTYQLIAIYVTDAAYLRTRGKSSYEVWADALRQTSTVQHRVAAATRFGSIQVITSTCSMARQFSGDRWLGVGDAAVALDPLCGLGILSALDSGIEGADVVSGGFTVTSQRKYDAALRQSYLEHLTLRAKYYRSEQRWPSSLFWQSRARDLTMPVTSAFATSNGLTRGGQHW